MLPPGGAQRDRAVPAAVRAPVRGADRAAQALSSEFAIAAQEAAMLQGLMQDRPLLISSLIEHANAFHPDAEIVSRTVEGPIHRCTYGDIHRRSKQVAKALLALGVAAGRSHRDARVERLPAHGALLRRVRHGRGAAHDQSAALSRSRSTTSSTTPRTSTCSSTSRSRRCVEKLAPQLKTVKGFVAMTDRAHMPALDDPEPAVLRGAGRRAGQRLRVAGVRRDAPRRRCATRRARRAIRRACSIRTARRCCIRIAACAVDGLGLSAAESRAAGRADVPRQRLGHALRRRDVRREARAARARRSTARASTS